MDLSARPTVRVLGELSRGWTNREHEAAVRRNNIRAVLPLSELGHPLIEQAVADTAAGAAAPSGNRIIRCVRDSTGEPWLEIKKTGTEWRGAVAYDESGVPWLIFATGRGHDAFYGEIKRAVEANGSAAYMPTDRDYGYLALERQLIADQEWSTGNIVHAIDCAAEALKKGSARCVLNGHPTGPGKGLGELCIELEPVNELTLNVATAHDDAVMLEAYITFTRPDNRRYADLLAGDLRSLLNPQPDAWEVAAKADGTTIYWAEISQARMLQLFASTVAGDVGEISRSMKSAAAVTHAHYAPRRPLAEATVRGIPVRAVCGYWFVPRHDHDGLPICERCASDLSIDRAVKQVTDEIRRTRGG